MIQFNLLPNIKLEYIKARRSKRVLMTSSVVVAGVCLVILLLLFSTVQFAQKKYLNDLTKDIQSGISDIKSIEDLDKILTIQNQLTSLPDLHKNKPLLSRVFTYIGQTTPANVAISKFDIDVASTTITVQGTADSIATINTYADTLKFATYDTESTKEAKPFTNVVTTLSRNEQSSSFTIIMTFDPIIFSGNEKVTLVVPNITTTRSETEKPQALFVPAPTEEGEGQ